ncbi:GNAT family N-acetyltransferase [Saccharopolyspora spinosa]|uniref:Ribosomal protein S18 acetylase RimI-like enzyme n=1 Tax=Saccharopolyspora spinosa TaxID=60894 RepID=A0A2N3XYJ5_SACSN|nr:GNAT family N-acetyltransferase [Saccharopolyspora spinosa]PKW15754.1 ribosomal protein S18 acetylase RimI-like enzyme [Saccharopolyspora spinosa]
MNGKLERLTLADAGEVLTLQRAAYVTEAQAHDDVQMPPLTQTLDDVRADLARPSCITWGFREAGRLVGSVRVELDGATAALGRLMVAPDRQGHGLGTGLLLHVERNLPRQVAAIELFTGEHSTANLRLYRRMGYEETHRTPAGTYELIHFRKHLR